MIKESIVELISAIADGDTIAIEDSFNTVMSYKIADRLDSMRVDVAQNMFSSVVEESVDVAAVRKEYARNEDDNNHSENAVLLAKHFGSKHDQNQAAKAINHRNKHGGYGSDPAGREHAKLSADIHSKLYHHIKEEVEDLDEVSRAGLSTYISAAKRDEKKDRSTGIALAQKKKWGDPKYGTTAAKVPAVDLKQNEDFEQLDELSKATLGSYVKKATSNLRDNAKAAGVAQALRKNNAASNRDDTAWKRTWGIHSAVTKLTKEGLDEESDATGIKIYHADKAGNASHTIVFTHQDAARLHGQIKKAGGKVTHHALMHGTKEGEKKAVPAGS